MVAAAVRAGHLYLVCTMAASLKQIGRLAAGRNAAIRKPRRNTGAG